MRCACLQAPAAEATVRSLRDSLRRGAQPQQLALGPYGEFTIDANGNYVMDRSGYYPSAVVVGLVLAYTSPAAGVRSPAPHDAAIPVHRLSQRAVRRPTPVAAGGRPGGWPYWRPFPP